MPISAALGSSALLPAGLGFRNKIINGDMRIAQRGASAVIANNTQKFLVDRWPFITNSTNTITVQQSSDAPVGFSKSVSITSGASPASGNNLYSFFYQPIEGFNISDLAWGTASAKPITLSFWVKVSANAIGKHTVALENPSSTRTYVATYTVSSTDWEYKTIQIVGPTSGTFPTDHTAGLNIDFIFGTGVNYHTATPNTWLSETKYSVSDAVNLCNTANASIYITGVQVEQNTQPTPFEQRPYGTELSLCQRYYEKSYDIGTAVGTNTNVGIIYIYGTTDGGGFIGGNIKFAVAKRSSAYTIRVWSLNASSSTGWNWGTSVGSGINTVNAAFPSTNQVTVYVGTGTGWTASFIYGHYAIDNEL